MKKKQMCFLFIFFIFFLASFVDFSYASYDIYTYDTEFDLTSGIGGITLRKGERTYEFNPYSVFTVNEEKTLSINRNYFESFVKIIEDNYESKVDSDYLKTALALGLIRSDSSDIDLNSSSNAIKNYGIKLDDLGLFDVILRYKDKEYLFSLGRVFFIDENGSLAINNNYYNSVIEEIEKTFAESLDNYIVKSSYRANRYLLEKDRVDKSDLEILLIGRILNQDKRDVDLPIKSRSGLAIENVSKIVSYTTPLDPKHDMPGKAYNTRLVGENFNGVKLVPGQVFSFQYYANSVNNSYQIGPVIYGNKIGGGVGGGICQVSTTLFNAALESGLQVVQRQNHSIPSQYAQKGRDAMVYDKARDFKMKNNFSHDIYIFYYQPQDNTSVNVAIYGNPSDIKNVEVVVSGSGKNYQVENLVNGKPYQRFLSTYSREEPILAY